MQRSAHPKPGFADFTAGKVMLGLIGTGLVIGAGNQITRDNVAALVRTCDGRNTTCKGWT